jgi:16S rRNA processing protein RimM
VQRPAGADDALVSVARVAGAHGIRGALRVRPHHAPSPSLDAGRQIRLRGNAGDAVHTVRRAAPHGRGLLLVELEGVTDRSAAERLAGSDVLVAAADLPPLDPHEFYYHEMPGFRVETVAGAVVGEIVETMHTGTTDVWIVRAGAREVLIPVVHDVVMTIDRETRRVVVAPMPGLLD